MAFDSPLCVKRSTAHEMRQISEITAEGSADLGNGRKEGEVKVRFKVVGSVVLLVCQTWPKQG